MIFFSEKKENNINKYTKYKDTVNSHIHTQKFTFTYRPTSEEVMTHLSEHSHNFRSIFIPLSGSLQNKITFLIPSAENDMLCGKLI